MSEFMRVATVHELSDPGKLVVEVDDRMLVLFLVDGTYSCLDDVCTHDGGPLGEGELDGNTIACPRHGAQFDVRTGKALTMPATEDTVVHEVKVEGDAIYVRVIDE
jgi:3-phenylpropionate/trans-cinnamate dioxygenase ferredoxin subunit